MARLPITTISDSALLIVLRCSSRFTAPPAQRAANRRKRNSCISFPFRSSPAHGDEEGGDDHVGKRGREEHLPAEAHQLVITEARQRAADPDVKEQEEENLGREVKQRQ